MADIRVEDTATRALLSALDGLSARQRVLSNNLANINTPGFKASEVSFAQRLNDAMGSEESLPLAQTSAMHLGRQASETDIRVTARTDISQRSDGNNVDLEKEMAQLAETVLHYEAAVRVVTQRLGMLRTVINEGRR